MRKKRLKKWIKSTIIFIVLLIELALLFQNNIIQVVNSRTIAISPRVLEVLFYNVSSIVIMTMSKDTMKEEE